MAIRGSLIVHDYFMEQNLMEKKNNNTIKKNKATKGNN